MVYNLCPLKLQCKCSWSTNGNRFKILFSGCFWSIATGDYGQQHVLAAIGYPVFSAVCGVLIDVTAKVSDNDVLTYLPLFSFYVFFMTCVCFNTCAISPSTSSQESSNFLKGIWEILKNLELVALFVTTVIYGILTGVSIAFLTWYLESLGALHTVIGTSTIMFCVFELPTLYKAGAIMDKLGMVNTMYLTYVIYALRFVGYGAMNTPWLIYAIEPLHGATSALMFTVTTAYAVSKSPSGFTATATGLTYGSQLLGMACIRARNQLIPADRPKLSLGLKSRKVHCLEKESVGRGVFSTVVWTKMEL